MNDEVAELREMLRPSRLGVVYADACVHVGILVEVDGVVAWANTRACELLGSVDVEGRLLREVVAMADPAAAERHDGWVREWRENGAASREMGARTTGQRAFAITITTTKWEGKPANMAVMLPSGSGQPHEVKA